MAQSRAGRVALVVAALVLPTSAAADIKAVAKCQKVFASAGANYAKKVIKYTLKCTTELSECQIQCEEGVFGPPCSSNPPPCCDPDDVNSNEAFGECIAAAQDVCDVQTTKLAIAEVKKQTRITNACSPLTVQELCGAETEGLNFASLNAGCLALDPSYTCTLTNLINCVGGPLQRQLLDQMAALLSPRAPGAVAVGGVGSEFPDIPMEGKAVGAVPAGLADIYEIVGTAGDQINVRVQTRDDNGNGSSSLDPALVLFDTDGTTPLDDTTVEETPCSVPNTCGGACAQLARTLPFDGTFRVAVHAMETPGCAGGAYRLIVQSPSGVQPILVADDVPFVASPGGAFLHRLRSLFE